MSRITIRLARKQVSDLLVKVWKTVDSIDEIDSQTYGYITALNEVIKLLGGIRPRIRECEHPDCHNIIIQTGSGRNRKHCSDVCRARTYRAKQDGK